MHSKQQDEAPTSDSWHPHSCPICWELWNHNDMLCDKKYQKDCRLCRDFKGDGC